MKYIDIDKRFSEIVTEYLNKGYTFNTAALNGSQGEIAKIDLTNGVEIIRVYIATFHDYSSRYAEGIEIIVGKSNEGLKPHEYTGWDTIWQNRLEVLNCERFYKIGRNRSGHCDYYGTEEEAKAAAQKRHDRYMCRDTGSSVKDFTDKAREIAKKVICREFGIMHPGAAHITVTKRKGKYTISYRNKVYTLH